MLKTHPRPPPEANQGRGQSSISLSCCGHSKGSPGPHRTAAIIFRKPSRTKISKYGSILIDTIFSGLFTSILTQLWLGVHGTVPGFWPIPMSKYSLRMFDTSPFIIPAKHSKAARTRLLKKQKSQASAVAGICQPNSRLRAHTCYIPIWTIFAYTLVSSINTENHRTPMISLILWWFFCV